MIKFWVLENRRFVKRLDCCENLEWIEKFEWPRFETWQKNIFSYFWISFFFICFWNFSHIFQPRFFCPKFLLKIALRILCMLPYRDFFLGKFRKLIEKKRIQIWIHYFLGFEPTSHQNLNHFNPRQLCFYWVSKGFRSSIHFNFWKLNDGKIVISLIDQQMNRFKMGVSRRQLIK